MKLPINKKLSHLMQALTHDFFAILFVDFTRDTVEVSNTYESAVFFLSDFLSKSKGYDDFVVFYAENYVFENDRELFCSSLEKNALRKKLSECGKISISVHQLAQDKKTPTEIMVIDVSDDGDGSECIIAARYVEHIIRNQEPLKKQNDMVKTLVRDYNTIYYIDLEKDSYIILQAQNVVNDDIYDYIYRNISYSESVRLFVEKLVLDEYKEEMLKVTKCDYVRERLKEEEGYSFRYQVKKTKGMEYFELRFLRAETIEAGNFAIMTVRNVDALARAEVDARQKIEMANKGLEEALRNAEAANQAKTDFLSRMSHDIRTPMNTIIGLTAIAGAHINNTDKLQDCLEKITSASRHLLTIINDILDMSRIESGKMNINEAAFSIPDMLNDVLEIIKPQVQAKFHELNVYIRDMRNEDVIGDYGHIQQVLINIMGNAVKYTPDGGAITLTVSERKAMNQKTGTFIFEIRDNGIGMKEEFVKHIFEPFEREEDLRISKIQGSGLGMAIAQNIIHLMGGTIEVTSEYGKGSCFKIVLPLKLQEAECEKNSELAGLPVLVADDDQVTCESTCMMLDELGMESEWVLTGEEAVEKTLARHREANDYFAVIIDWKMPEMDGMETVRRIRGEVGRDVPIIILSAYDWSDIEAEARDAGVNAFMNKPLFLSSLRNTFRNIMNHENKSSHVIADLHVLEQDNFSRKKVLLVEDNDLNRDIMAEILMAANVEVATAEDGLDAVKKFADSEPGYFSMIFMDIQMPNMNGLDATRAIRAMDRPDATTIPIIALTANTFEWDVQETLQAGMNEHVAKPVDLVKLDDVMRRWIG